jgi:hypothetical protein
MTEDQARLNTEATERTLRVGRQMTAFTDALFAGVKPVEPDYTISVTKYGRMMDDGKREVRHGMTPAEAFVEYVPPFRVEQYFASDSYYFEVVDSKGQRLNDYDSEGAANWMRNYMNAGGDRGDSRLQKWCSDCSGTGHAFGSPCQTCGGQGALP